MNRIQSDHNPRAVNLTLPLIGIILAFLAVAALTS